MFVNTYIKIWALTWENVSKNQYYMLLLVKCNEKNYNWKKYVTFQSIPSSWNKKRKKRCLMLLVLKKLH